MNPVQAVFDERDGSVLEPTEAEMPSQQLPEEGGFDEVIAAAGKAQQSWQRTEREHVLAPRKRQTVSASISVFTDPFGSRPLQAELCRLVGPERYPH